MQQYRHHFITWLILTILAPLFTACIAITPNHPQFGSTVPGEPAVVINQRAVLAIQLGVDPSAIEIVAAEPMTWPDACLGKPEPTELCAQAATPGYRITLAVNGAEYTYHTNTDGTNVRLADAPAPPSDVVIVEWTQNDDNGCNTVEIRQTRVVFGRCGSTLMSVSMRYATRQADLAEFTQTFAPFVADTPAGQVEFNGAGTVVATPAQQRMIAEWVQLVGLEARTDSSGPNGGLVLAWQREGGRAGFCDDVMIYRGGAVYVSSCQGQSAEPNQFRLNSAQLATLYTWMDTFAPFNVTYPGAEQRDGMTVTLTFTGGGKESMTEPTPALMMDFAQNLFNESRIAQQVLPAGCMPSDAERQILLDEAAAYCLLYPAAYSLWQQNAGTTEIISDTVMNHITPRASISVEAAADRTLDAVVQQMLTDYAPPGFNITPTTITVDGVAAVLLDEAPGQDLTRRVVLIHNGRLYTLFFAPIGEAGTETRQQAEALYQTVIESFHLLPQAETDSGVSNKTSSATDATPDDSAVLLWEGQPLFAENADACGWLTIDRYDTATIGACGEKAGAPQPLGDTHQREWLELQARLWGPTEVELIGHKLFYRPDGEAQGGAWQRAFVAWTQLVHAELATGQISASGATALHWVIGPVPEQPESCRRLTVLRYGYAYAATAPCAGGPTQAQLGDWLTDAEMIQFDIWLHQFGDLYVDDNYLAGRGERAANEAERAEVAAWAEQVYARLAAHAPPSPQPDLGTWQRYEADSGYAIAYPLSLYSLRLAQQSAATVLFPGVRVIEPNDAFVYRQPGQNTYKLSITVQANEQGRTLDPDLFTNSVLIAYGADVLTGQPIQEIELDGVPALRVDDLSVGPTGVTAHIVALHQDRIYELMIEPHTVTTNLATPYVASASNAANQALIEEVLSTFHFVE